MSNSRFRSRLGRLKTFSLLKDILRNFYRTKTFFLLNSNAFSSISSLAQREVDMKLVHCRATCGVSLSHCCPRRLSHCGGGVIDETYGLYSHMWGQCWRGASDSLPSTMGRGPHPVFTLVFQNWLKMSFVQLLSFTWLFLVVPRCWAKAV